MLSFIRASKPLMKIACDLINSNMDLYKGILDNPNDIQDYLVNDEWIQKNFTTREFYLLKDQQEYVAMGSFQKLAQFGYIGYLHVRNGHFGKGYGSMMLRFLELRAKNEGIIKIHLFTHPKAPWAMRFYKKHGYEIFKEMKTEIQLYCNGVLIPYHGKKHILWKKVLNQTNEK